jgi:hypothetical protein
MLDFSIYNNRCKTPAYLQFTPALLAVRMGIGAPEIEYKEAQNDNN